MSPTPTSAILETVEQLAAQCGIAGEHNLLRGEFVVLFSLPGDRTQEVYVSDSSPNPEVVIVSIRSTCLVMDKTKFETFGNPIARELMALNEKLNIARYGLQETEDSVIVVASYDLLLDQLKANQLAFYLECVALAADSYEEKFGQDLF